MERICKLSRWRGHWWRVVYPTRFKTWAWGFENACKMAGSYLAATENTRTPAPPSAQGEGGAS